MADCGVTFTHGGDVRGFFSRFGKTPLDFSANINPLGVPPKVRRALCAAAKEADRYPDPACRDLRAAIAESVKINAEQVFCGAGAADIIYRLAAALKPRRALVPAPTFSEYSLALTAQGCEVKPHYLKAENNFDLTEEILPLLNGDIDIMFLCNPNNPTGRLTDAALLKEILKRCEKYNIGLVVDECFIGFTPAPEQFSLTALLPEYKNLVILNAFTKLYGMAGARLGFCLCGDSELPPRLYGAGPPWNVSSLAQQAGIAALDEVEYLKKSRAMVAAECERMQRAFNSLGLRAIPAQANYILFYSAALGLGEMLGKNGVMIRDCSNFDGLGEGWYRTAVRLPRQNDTLIKALKSCL